MGEATLHNEKELLAKVADSDELAFRQVFDHYRKKIYSHALHITESSLQADEIVQEVFMKVWLYRANLLRVQYFNTWLHSIAKNCIFDALKRIARESTIKTELASIILDTNNSVEDGILLKENEKLLQEAFSRLSGQQQIVYHLSRHQGLKHDEIAARLNISPNTVKVHIVNALKTIREYVRFHSDYEFALILIGCSFL